MYERNRSRSPTGSFNNRTRPSPRYTSRGPPRAGSTSPIIENPPINDFQKDFLPQINLPSSQIQAFRKEHKMTIKGEAPPPILEFSLLKDIVNHQTLNNLTINFPKPTCIQAQGWSMALKGLDLVAIAQTGSGKTLSFVLPALVHCKAQLSLRKNDGPICLILAPTRELCMQIYEVVCEYSKFYNLKAAAVYGGAPAYPQKKALKGGVEIVVATPGRLIDLHKQHCVSLQRATFVVLDEADRMLDMGFEPQLREILEKTHKDRQTLMWSATWPREVRVLADSYLKNFVQVNVGADKLQVNRNITQEVVVLENYKKKEALLDILSKHTQSGASGEEVYYFL